MTCMKDINIHFVYKYYYILLLLAPPQISIGQSDMSVIQGFQALLPCAAQGLPEPRVNWEKQGVPVSTFPGKFTLLRSGELVIERAEVSNMHFIGYKSPECLFKIPFI